MVPTVQALDWLIDTMIDRVGEWKGTKQLRGLLCQKFRPLDDVEADCEIAGFTPDDNESRAIEEHEQRKIDAKRDSMPGIGGAAIQ